MRQAEGRPIWDLTPPDNKRLSAGLATDPKPPEVVDKGDATEG